MSVINGLTTAPEVIEAMRQMRLGGDSYESIAAAMQCARSTVRRHCLDLPAPVSVKLDNKERGRLLQNWRPVYREGA